MHCLMSWGDCDPQKKNDKYALPSTSKVIIRWKGEMFMIDCFKTWKIRVLKIGRGQMNFIL